MNCWLSSNPKISVTKPLDYASKEVRFDLPGSCKTIFLSRYFALGHSVLLLAAGVSVGFAQSITSNEALGKFSNLLNKLFALMLMLFGLYFFYQASLQF